MRLVPILPDVESSDDEEYSQLRVEMTVTEKVPSCESVVISIGKITSKYLSHQLKAKSLKTTVESRLKMNDEAKEVISVQFHQIETTSLAHSTETQLLSHTPGMNCLAKEIISHHKGAKSFFVLMERSLQLDQDVVAEPCVKFLHDAKETNRLSNNIPIIGLPAAIMTQCRLQGIQCEVGVLLYPTNNYPSHLEDVKKACFLRIREALLLKAPKFASQLDEAPITTLDDAGIKECLVGDNSKRLEQMYI